MPSPARRDRRRPLVLAACLALLALLAPTTVSAHAELQSSDPVQGATVPSPFSGPVVLTFTESLAVGSKADLYGPGHLLVASATIDAGTMTIPTSGALAPGDYTVEWVSVADDGDLLRGKVEFTVAPAASASPSATATATATASAEPTATATNPPSATASAAATPEASPAPPSDGGGSTSDVILPIVIALLVAAAGAFYLVRRNRPA